MIIQEKKPTPSTELGSHHHKVVGKAHTGQLRLVPSRIWLLGIVALHLLMLLAILLTAMSTYLKVFLLVLLLFTTIRFCWGWFNQPVYYLRYLYQRWQLFPALVEADGLVIRQCCFWSNYLLILDVQDGSARKHFPLVFDQCSSEHYRRLRVSLKGINTGEDLAQT